MKVTIEIWQSEINDEWNCDITTTKDQADTKEYWAVEHFCELLNLLGEHFPKAKIVAKPEVHVKVNNCQNCGGTGFIYQGDLSEPTRCGYGCTDEGKL